MGNIIVINTEDDERKVIDMIKKAKGKKLLVAIHSLEEEDTPVSFIPKLKSECEALVKSCVTVAAIADECLKEVYQVRAYTELQNDLKNLSPHGFEKTILFPFKLE